MTHFRAMPLAADAQQRLDALRRFLVVDAPEEDELARLVRVAATVYGVAYAVLALREAPAEAGEGDGPERVAAAFGTDADEFGSDAALIDGIEEPALPMTVTDVSEDKRFARNPLVTSGKARFYAGVPLKSAHGFTIGTLAVLDPEPQELNGEGLSLLVDLGALAEPVLNQREFQRERNAAVAVRDAATQERTSTAAERDAALAERDAARTERDAADAERDATAAERDALKGLRDTLVLERDAAQKARQTAHEAREKALSEVATAVAEREAAIAARDEARDERDAAIAERSVALTERDGARADLEAAMRARDAALAERDAARAERDATLAERGTGADDLRAAIAERDSARTQAEAVESERAAAVRELATVKTALDTATAALSEATNARDDAVRARNTATAERDEANATVQAAGAATWSRLLDAAPAPLLVAASDGGLLYANDRARMLLGLGDDVTGDSLARVIAPTHATRLATLLSQPSARPAELDIKDATGATRPVRMSVAPAPVAGDGAVLFAIRTLETERRLAQALHEREEALAAATAPQPAPEPDALITTIRQEVRSSLEALAEYAALQKAQAADISMREMAGAVGGVATRLLRVMEGTFGLAGLDAAHATGLAPVAVGPALESAADPYRAPAEARDLAFVVDAPDELVCAWAEPSALAHVLDALISNAVAHTARGGVRLRVTQDDDRTTIEVQDTGVGLDAPTLASALAGGDNGVARPGGGLGLGLALARRMTDRMGAELTGHSVPGQGSVFRLILRSAPRAAEEPGGDGVAVGARARSAA